MINLEIKYKQIVNNEKEYRDYICLYFSEAWRNNNFSEISKHHKIPTSYPSFVWLEQRVHDEPELWMGGNAWSINFKTLEEVKEEAKGFGYDVKKFEEDLGYSNKNDMHEMVEFSELKIGDKFECYGDVNLNYNYPKVCKCVKTDEIRGEEDKDGGISFLMNGGDSVFIKVNEEENEGS